MVLVIVHKTAKTRQGRIFRLQVFGAKVFQHNPRNRHLVISAVWLSAVGRLLLFQLVIVESA
jgi:hypothetical protein